MSESYERGGKPRSVPDPHGEASNRMIREHRAMQARKEAASAAAENSGSPALRPPRTKNGGSSPTGHQRFEPRQARLEWDHGHKGRALVDAVTAAGDLGAVGLGVRGLLAGRFKLRGPFTWRTKPWEEGLGARQWMANILQAGEHGHHGIIPNNGWGKHVPEAIKNQPANIVGRDALTHARIHGASRKFGLPRYNAA